MSNAKFRQDMARIVDKTKNKQNTFVRALCLELDRSMVLKSPVDTGRFKANWNVSYGAPDSGLSEALDPSPYKTVSAGSASIIKANEKLKSFIAGSTVFITNSLPYSYRLEYEGWSKQSPQGMVRITLAELNSNIQKVGAEVKAL